MRPLLFGEARSSKVPGNHETNTPKSGEDVTEMEAGKGYEDLCRRC